MDTLILQWDNDNLGVSSETKKLNDLFKSAFRFSSETWNIPSVEPEWALTYRLKSFTEGKQPGDLLILYYGGHAGGAEDECIWAATEEENSPKLNWHNVQGHILGCPADVLFILDCCRANLALRNYAKSDVWLLSATDKGAPTTGVARHSFTSALTRELERFADHHKSYDHELSGKSFSVQAIHSALLLHDKDLRFDPHIVRLTHNECASTDLTPLAVNNGPRRIHTMKTDPPLLTSQQLDDPSSDPIPVRHRPKHGTLPSNTTEGQASVNNSSSLVPKRSLLIGLSSGESQTVQISGLPSSVEVQDIINFFEDRLKEQRIVTKVEVTITGPSASGTVTFVSVAAAMKALAIKNLSFRTRRERQVMVMIDNKFHGLTCLYTPTRNFGIQSAITVDIIFVHGSHGHAINSFACHYITPAEEFLWPRDKLPAILEVAGVRPRIMTYGWNGLATSESVEKASGSLQEDINYLRSDCPKRPLVFIGHGAGGILVKQTINEIINSGIVADEHFESPVKACLFFAVPHRGTGSEAQFSPILAAIDSSLRQGGLLTEPGIGAFERQESVISNLSELFDDNRLEWAIGTTSFYEKPDTEHDILVPEKSAILDEKPGKSHAVDARYRDIVKLPKADRMLDPVLDMIRRAIGRKLGIAQFIERPMQQKRKEQVFAKLKQYDTVFVVDDSGSMRWRRWRTASKVLAKIASIAVKYDRDGVDIHFFNALLDEDEGRNLDTAEKVMALFTKVEPDGPTPTADVLDVQLNEYLFEYKKNRRRKMLNLIVLTDGEPERGQDVERIIVKYAQRLEKLEAPQLQVGVQFVQIGGDRRAKAFLETLDDKLQEKYDLDRDVGGFNSSRSTKEQS